MEVRERGRYDGYQQRHGRVMDQKVEDPAVHLYDLEDQSGEEVVHSYDHCGEKALEDHLHQVGLRRLEAIDHAYEHVPAALLVLFEEYLPSDRDGLAEFLV